MSLKPWREIATPHKDVLEGTFKQSEFAADISQVVMGTAPEEYQDAEKFFSRTFITEGMRLLLISVAQRLAGQGGDPVIQLQTAFGGGKTHTLLAVYHLARYSEDHSHLEGIPPLLDVANINALPQARVAVIDGIKLSPSHPQQHGTVTANTLWGELAWQLLGEQGYAKVAASDADGTSPGKAVLCDLIQAAAPCVILIDELLAFVRQLRVNRQFKAGTFSSNLSFIQALTEALKQVPNAILLASLPESELEAGDAMGQRTLVALEKYFARVESVWKPVSSTEAFEIVRRRLFETAGESAQVEGICRQFSDFYRTYNDRFPTETQSNVYFERLCQSYPIHPEIFDRLYEDWSTLDKFQRTRGVLQYMAIVIHHLWLENSQDALILPGSLPLSDSVVRNKSIHYLPTGWEPVLEKEIDGTSSIASEIDRQDSRLGSVLAARRSTRTIFLGSAPAASNQQIKGLEFERILLGCVQPGQTIGIFEDVLKRLRDRLHYLYEDNNRFWFDTKPNLRREMESRKQRIQHSQRLFLLENKLKRLLGRGKYFAGIHIFTRSADVPDDFSTGLRLVVLLPDAAYSKVTAKRTYEYAEKILRYRGEQARQKQNRLIFLAPDYDAMQRLNDQVKTYLAWCEIVADIEQDKLNLDLFQAKQAKESCKTAERNLMRFLRETYKWLLCPVVESRGGKPELEWEVASVSLSASSLLQEIENRLREEEWLISEWSAIHLKRLLEQYYFKEDVTEVSAIRVYQDCCCYLYLPRLYNDKVLLKTITQGLATQDFFAFAAGKDGERYLGFNFGNPSSIVLDEASLLIDRDIAEIYQERNKPKPVVPETYSGGGKDVGVVREPKSVNVSQRQSGEVSNVSRLDVSKDLIKKQFFASIRLDPAMAKMEFVTIVDEIIDQFRLKSGVEINISVEIEASLKEGFDESLQRTIKENCNTLKFNQVDFEE